MTTDLILAVCLLAVAGVAGCILWLAVLDGRRARWLAEHPEEAERLEMARLAQRQREDREREVRP